MSMTAFAHDIATRLNGHSAYIEKGSGSEIAAHLREIAAIVPADMKPAFAARQVEILSSYGYVNDNRTVEKPFAYAEGIAFIPIHGMLVNRMSWSYSFATGYNFIRSQMNAALEDEDVKLIVYDINSSGGLASGCKELADEMYASRDVKPSLAVIDARCYSAAYFLGCACTRMVCTPSGGTGSIGCAAVHIEFSEMLKAEGIKVTLFSEGDEKTDGNQYEPLSKTAKQSIQRDVGYHYGLFTEAVARNRDLPEDDVRATEARCYSPPEALELGLIDAIQTPIEAVSEYYNELTTDSETEVDFVMAQQNNGTAGAPNNTAPVSAAALTADDVKRIVAESIGPVVSSAVSEALSAQAAATARVAAITGCEEAKDKPKLAAALAGNVALSLDDAKVILAAAAAETPQSRSTRQAPNDYFSRAMDNTQNPNVGAEGEGGEGGGEGGGPAQPHETANRLLGNYVATTGRKVIGINDKRDRAA